MALLTLPFVADPSTYALGYYLEREVARAFEYHGIHFEHYISGQHGADYDAHTRYLRLVVEVENHTELSYINSYHFYHKLLPQFQTVDPYHLCIWILVIPKLYAHANDSRIFNLFDEYGIEVIEVNKQVRNYALANNAFTILKERVGKFKRTLEKLVRAQYTSESGKSGKNSKSGRSGKSSTERSGVNGVDYSSLYIDDAIYSFFCSHSSPYRSIDDIPLS
jgi:hypothetical protein